MIPRFLRDDYPLEKHLFLIPKFALQLIGFYPASKPNTPLLCWAVFNFLILGYGSYAEFIYGIHYLTIDMQTALDALCPVLSSIMSLIKIFFIWWHRNDYKHLIEAVRRLTETQSSVKNMHIKRKFFTIATRLTALVLFFGFNTSTAYTVRLVISNTILYLNQQRIVYETPFKMMFPQPLLAMPIYPLTCILSHWHGYITVAAFVGADGFFLGFCFYFATLFKMLQQDLIDTLAVNNSLLAKNSQAIRCEADMISNLTDIVRRHNEIAQLMKKFSSIMVGIVLSHFITSSLIIGTSVMELLLGDYDTVPIGKSTEPSNCFWRLVLTVTFRITSMPFQNTETTNLTHTNFQNSSSLKMAGESEELALKAYCSQWYDYSVRIQKMVLLIMIRSQQTITVKVPFLTPALPMLTALVVAKEHLRAGDRDRSKRSTSSSINRPAAFTILGDAEVFGCLGAKVTK
uniref:Odorant receptor n=1 Tax=Glossina austeni TaxID=7395 RepID=A0A1A9UGR2_GLOAU